MYHLFNENLRNNDFTARNNLWEFPFRPYYHDLVSMILNNQFLRGGMKVWEFSYAYKCTFHCLSTIFSFSYSYLNFYIPFYYSRRRSNFDLIHNLWSLKRSNFVLLIFILNLKFTSTMCTCPTIRYKLIIYEFPINF